MSVLFFEIGFEEFPCTYIKGVQEQLEDRVHLLMDQHRFKTEETTIQVWASPRRLIVKVSDILLEQEDQKEFVFGPPVQVARDKEGQLTVAGLSFLRKNSIDETVIIDQKDSRGRQCISYEKESRGQSLKDIFPVILEDILTSFQFPKSMRFIEFDSFRFARPLRWLVVLIDGSLLKLDFKGICSSSSSFSIRQGVQSKSFDLSSSLDFEKLYLENGVIIDSDKRKETILQMIEQRLSEQNLKYDLSYMLDEELLEDVVMSVEDVDVLIGSFDEKYLELPDIVLLEVMKVHHKFFPVIDSSGSLKPYFLSVLNGKKDVQLVKRGNERVLRARYEDALFFVQEDSKNSIDSFVQKLPEVTFHQAIGSYQIKVDKMKNIVHYFSQKMGWSKETISLYERASQLCKFDLLTSIVYELPDLQGKMGAYYARQQGEDSRVCQMIQDHYLPLDEIKDSLSIVFALIDHLSNFILGFDAELKVSGSSDPYGLRRDCIFIIESILSESLDIDFFALIDHYILKDKQKEVAYDFVLERVRQVLMSRYNFSRSCSNALLDGRKSLCLPQILQIGNLLTDRSLEETLRRFSHSFLRIKKIIKNHSQGDFQSQLFSCSQEKDLYTAYEKSLSLIQKGYDKNTFLEVLQALSLLFDPIDSLFDQVMIMDPDETVRLNRLSLLYQVSQLERFFVNSEALDRFIGEEF